MQQSPQFDNNVSFTNQFGWGNLKLEEQSFSPLDEEQEHNLYIKKLEDKMKKLTAKRGMYSSEHLDVQIFHNGGNLPEEKEEIVRLITSTEDMNDPYLIHDRYQGGKSKSKMCCFKFC